MDHHASPSATHAHPDAGELPDEILAALDNFHPEGYSSTGVSRGIGVLRDEGWLHRSFDAAFSCHGHDAEADARAGFSRQLRLLYDVGRGSLPLGRIFEGHVNALELVARFATDAQRERYYAEAKSGKMFGVWNTEAADGINVYDLGDGQYEIKGRKTFCSGASDVERPIITGHLWRGGKVAGWQMLIVPMERVDDSRVDDSFWSPLGMQASASFAVDFTGIRVAEGDLLGAVDDYHAQPHFSGGAIRFAAVQLGGARALYDHATAMLKGMHREHDPYQAHRIADMEMAHRTGLNWLTLAPQYALPGHHADADVIHYANMTRTAILRCCNEILDVAEMAVGARGFLRPKPIQRIYCDLRMYLRQPAPDNALAAVGRHAAERSGLPQADAETIAAAETGTS